MNLSTSVKDVIRRAARTFFQAFVGVVVLQTAAIALDAAKGEYVLDIGWWQRLGVSAVVSGFIALCSFVQNWLEDKDAVPKLLKPEDTKVGDAVIDRQAAD